MDVIPFIPIQTKEEQRYLRIMEVGNRLLKNWSERFLGKRKKHTFRQMLFNGDICIESTSFCSSCEHYSIPRSDYDKIMDVREIEWNMLCGFAPLARSHAKHWNLRIEEDLFEDLSQVAHLALLDAIYGYIPSRSSEGYKRANFMTYAWRVIQRRLRREVENHCMPLLPPSADSARELMMKFEYFRRHYNDHLTFDAAAELMGLTQEQQRVLSSAMVNVMRESEMYWTSQNKWDCENNPVRNDYTIFAANLNVDEPIDVGLVEDVKLCIKLANLSDFQADLLVASQTPYHGWKAAVAERHGRTRQASSQAFKKACELVRKKYYEHFGSKLPP